MDDDFGRVGKGLKLLFVGELFLLLSNLISPLRVPILFVGFILSLMGLNTAAQENPGFQRAMSLLVASIAANLGTVFAPPGGVVALVLVLVDGAVSFGALYLICTTAADMVEARGDFDLAQQGRFVWKLNLFCTVAVLVSVVLTVLPPVALLLMVLFAGVAVASVAGGVLYLIFLHNVSRYLGT